MFDVSDNLFLIQCTGGREVKREKITLNHHDPFHRAKEVTGLGTQTLICGAVSTPLETALEAGRGPGHRVCLRRSGDGSPGLFERGTASTLLSNARLGSPGPANPLPPADQPEPGDAEMGKNGKGVMVMPRGDKTGPLGQGPMTGRGAGPCASGSSKGVLGRKLTGISDDRVLFNRNPAGFRVGLVWAWVEAEEVSRDGGTVGAGSIGSIGNGHFFQPINKTK